MSSSFDTARLARYQLVATLAVVAIFVAGSIALVGRMQTLDSEIYAISGNAMPSISCLSRARGDLRLIESALEEATLGESGALPDSLPALRQSLEADLNSYLALPSFPGERTLYKEADSAKAQFDAASAAALAATGTGDPSTGRSSFRKALRASSRLDAALERVIEFNAEQGERLGLHLTAARRDIVEVTMLVDGAISAFALAGTVLAIVMWRRSLAAAQQRSTELDLFAGRVAHDILSPLMAVGLGLAVVEQRLEGDPAARTALERSKRSMGKARELVNGLLEFARAGAPLSPERGADVDEAVRGVIETAENEAAAAGIDLTVGGRKGQRAACSPGVLASIVQNLVRNALKYMGDVPVKRVAVTVRDQGRFVRVQVEDTGPGIPPGIATEIFKPFVRGSTVVPGTGLGLATVKKLVDAHGGRVGCQSAPGVGSVFWFELPVLRETRGERPEFEGRAPAGLS